MVKELLAVCPLHQHPEANAFAVSPRDHGFPAGRVWLPVVPTKALLRGRQVPFPSPAFLPFPSWPALLNPYGTWRNFPQTWVPLHSCTVLGSTARHDPEGGRTQSLGFLGAVLHEV